MKNDYAGQISRDPLTASVLSKVTDPAPSQGRGKRPDGGTTPLRTELAGLTSSRIRMTKNSLRIYESLPEMETIVTIATSSILSTKDLVNASLIYDCEDKDIPLAVRDALNEVTREYFNATRKLPKKAYRWIYDAMKWKGASPVLVMSDSGFDDTFSLRKVAGESNRSNDIREHLASTLQRVSEQRGFLGEIKKKEEKANLLDRQMLALESLIGGGSTRATGPQTMELDLASAFQPILDEYAAKFKVATESNKESGAFKFNTQLSTKMSLSLTDNCEILKLPKMARKLARESQGQNVQTGYLSEQAYDGTGPGKSLDGATKPEDLNLGRDRLTLADLVEHDTNQPVEMKPYAEMPRLAFGQKNTLDYTEIVLPASSTAPVTMGGDTRNPIGWLTIIDDMGNFVNANSTMYGDVNFYNYLSDNGMADSTINRAYSGLGHSNVAPEIAQRLSNRFGELAEDYFTESLGTAMGGVELDIPMTETFVKVLLTRHLAKRHTQVLYIPAENLAYFATAYDEDGFGVSLPERSFVISTVRMALLFAYMNASVLNAARFMQYDIELSPDDMNGQETVDRLKSDILNSFNRRMPQWGNMDDAWSMAANANIAFNVVGNQYYSSHKVSMSDTTPEYKTPDMDFDNELLRRTARLAWVDPDLVLNPENIEFASQIFSKSLIMTSQIQAAQEELSEPLSNYVKAGIKASPVVQADMLKALVKLLGIETKTGEVHEELQKLNGYIQAYTAAVKVTIPPPDTSAAASQMELFDKRVEFIDKIVDIVVNDTVVAKINEANLDFQGDELKALVRAYYLRNWMSQQGMETDLLNLITDKGEQADNIKAISDETRDTLEMLLRLGKRTGSKVETVLNSIGAETDPEAAPDMGGEAGETSDAGTDDEGLDGLDDGLDDGTDGGTGTDDAPPTDDDTPPDEDADNLDGGDTGADTPPTDDASTAGEADPDGDLAGLMGEPGADKAP